MSIIKKYLCLLDDTIDYISTGFRTNRNESICTKKRNTDESARSTTRKGPNKTNLAKYPNQNRNILFNENSEKTKSKSSVLLLDISEEIFKCTRCPLHKNRLNPVPGKGNPDADIVFIGEGPGQMEDIKGEPFVGKAGQLLTKMLNSINLSRGEVYITNIVKCRPPGNRTPQKDEINACFPFLERQLDVIKPLIICCLGGPAIKTLIKSDEGIKKLRGKIYYYKNIPVIPTYHPAAVLRFPDRYKREVWNDLKLLRSFYMEIKK